MSHTLPRDFRPNRDGFYLGPLECAPNGSSSQLPRTSVEPLNNTGEPWSSLYQQGYKDVLSTVFDVDVTDTEGNTPGSKKDNFMKAGRSMLAAMSEETVMSIIDGTLPLFTRSHPGRPDAGRFVRDAGRECQVQYRGRTYQPMLYASYLVNHRGVPPTEFELSTIINFVENYARGESVAFNERIDMTIPGCPHWIDHQRGDRRYMMVDTDDELQECLDFISAVRQHLPDRPSTEDVTRALGCFGVTNHAGWCFTYHARHQGGRSLMYLVEAVCAMFFPAYSIKHHVVFKAFEPDHLWAGEILLNVIGKGHRDTGYGFGFFGRDRDYEETAMKCVYDIHYSMWEKTAIKNTPLRANLSARISQIQARRLEAANTKSEEELVESEEYLDDGDEVSVLVGMLYDIKYKV